MLAAAVVLTRQDLLLIVTPLCVAWIARKGFQRAAVPLLAGAGSVAAWELFSLVYYGNLVPNTGLAKLNTGMPAVGKMIQGLRYVGDFALRDPAGFFFLASCLVFLVTVRKDLKARAVAGGIVLYVLYIVSIGGDFMSGRFFTAPVFLAVAETVRTTGERMALRVPTISGARIVAVLLVAVRLVGFNGFSAEVISANGIADERRFYAPALSLGALHDGREYRKG